MTALILAIVALWLLALGYLLGRMHEAGCFASEPAQVETVTPSNVVVLYRDAA